MANAHLLLYAHTHSTCLEDLGWIECFEIDSGVGPSKDGQRKDAGREPECMHWSEK